MSTVSQVGSFTEITRDSKTGEEIVCFHVGDLRWLKNAHDSYDVSSTLWETAPTGMYDLLVRPLKNSLEIVVENHFLPHSPNFDVAVGTPHSTDKLTQARELSMRVSVPDESGALRVEFYANVKKSKTGFVISKARKPKIKNEISQKGGQTRKFDAASYRFLINEANKRKTPTVLNAAAAANAAILLTRLAYSKRS